MFYIIATSTILGLMGLICIQWTLDVRQKRTLIPQRIKSQRRRDTRGMGPNQRK